MTRRCLLTRVMSLRGYVWYGLRGGREKGEGHDRGVRDRKPRRIMYILDLVNNYVLSYIELRGFFLLLFVCVYL